MRYDEEEKLYDNWVWIVVWQLGSQQNHFNWILAAEMAGVNHSERNY